jgi:hypothetical protein
MVRDQQSKVTPHTIFGVFIALLGVIFTLDNLGLADTGSLIRFWPVLPIAVGVIMLMHADSAREWIFGTAWMAAGGLILARNLGWLSFRLKDFLPLLLVAVGARLIWRDRQRPAAPPAPASPTWETEVPPEAEATPVDRPPPIPSSGSTPPPLPRVDTGASSWEKRTGNSWGSKCDWRSAGFTSGGRTPWQQWESWQSWRGRHWAPRRGHVRMLALMSGVERRIRAESFSSAEMTAIMGACELDLRQSQMSGTEAHITAFALWGGIEIRVPEHWVVVNRSMALMGGVEDTTRHVESPERPRLYVHGFALMAGIEIKN